VTLILLRFQELRMIAMFRIVVKWNLEVRIVCELFYSSHKNYEEFFTSSSVIWNIVLGEYEY
jgi:hypothetical protein